MAIFSGEIRSKVLGMDTGLNVVMPYDRPAKEQAEPCKVLYLLHGLGNNHTSWCRNTNVEKTVEEYGYAVVMPDAAQSFYANQAYGPAYFDYISKELPELVGKFFNVSQKPEDTFIAGVSMGGYGALKIALTNPENYAGVCSFSGAFNHESMIDIGKEFSLEKQIIGILGQSLEVTKESDLYYLASQLKKELPLYIICGTEDYLYEDNVKFAEYLTKIEVDHKFDKWKGSHEWPFWNEALPKALKFFNNI